MFTINLENHYIFNEYTYIHISMYTSQIEIYVLKYFQNLIHTLLGADAASQQLHS